MRQGKNVMITLHSTIDDLGEKEINTFQQKGKFFTRNNFEVILYEEVQEDGEKINNLITIQPDRVHIKRSGFISMSQQFEVSHRTETYYEHPHGSIHMETYTNSIDYYSLNETSQGKLVIVYTVTLNGMEKRKHIIELTYEEEDS